MRKHKRTRNHTCMRTRQLHVRAHVYMRMRIYVDAYMSFHM